MAEGPARTVSSLSLLFAVAWGAENVTGTWRPFFEGSFVVLMWLFVAVLSVGVPLWIWGQIDNDAAKATAGKNNSLSAAATLVVLGLSPTLIDVASGAL